MLAFTSSIIGLLYSYNKKIILITSQEKDNYRKTYLKFRESFLNLYIAENFNSSDISSIRQITITTDLSSETISNNAT
jgi:hypothetical protein